MGIPILCYHRVHTAEDAPAVPAEGYCGHVVVEAFRRQMEALAERGFRTATHRELAGWLLDGKRLPERSVLIDFDDNRLNVYQNAFPIMKELGFTGTVFVVSQLAEGADLGDMSHPYPAMGWGELRDLAEAGWTMGAHTRTHVELDKLLGEEDGRAKCEREIAGSREEIEERLGGPVEWFAYPVGLWNEEVEGIVKGSFRTARHWRGEGEAVYNTRETNPYRLQANNVSAQLAFEGFVGIVEGAL